MTNVLKKRPILLEYNTENLMKKILIVGWKLTISRKIIHRTSKNKFMGGWEQI